MSNARNNAPKKRGSAALIIWLMIFMAGILLFMFGGSSGGVRKLTPSEFVDALHKGEIESATITTGPDRFLNIRGEIVKKSPSAVVVPRRKKEKKKDPAATETREAKFQKDQKTADAKASDKKANDTKASDTQPVDPVPADNKTVDTKEPVQPTPAPAEILIPDKGGKLQYEVNILGTDKLLEELHRPGKVKQLTYEENDSWWKGLLLNIGIGILIIFLLYFLFARQIRGAGQGAMQFGKSKARMIPPDELKTRFDDVAGCDEAKEETREIVEYLKDPLKYKLLGGKIPKGALLTGPPGTGKTLMAKAVAGEANVPFFSISGSDFVEMFVGVGASRVRDMFDQARKNAPSVIFIDEIDAVGRSRFSGIGGGHDEREQTLNAMLVEMDGLETQEGAVIVLAATNRVDVLDPALLRPGRFDRQIVIDLPDIRGRRQILAVHAKNIKLDPEADLDVIARSTPGFSGADLANLINEAALLAARNDRTAATQNDLEEARDKVCFGRERRSRRIPDHERKLTAFHEAGHALVDIYCEHGTPLHKVTIIPRGQALGMTMMMDKMDRYSRTRNEMLDAIAMSLGGRVAEELTLDDISSGASQDIAHATDIAHAMVCAYGMSDKLGTVKYGERSEHIYLGRDITRNESCSEETLREIDMEVKQIIAVQKKRATDILTEHREQLDKLAGALLEQETMDAKEIYELLGIPMPPPPPQEEI